MDPLDDFLEQQRRITPPQDRTQNIERAVMARLSQGESRHASSRVALAFAGLLIITFFALAILYRPRTTYREQAPDFVESVVLLPGHACIWLEPIEKPAQVRR